MRGLDSTCTSPWVSRKFSRAAKLLVWNARPNSVPATEPDGKTLAAAGSSVAPGVAASTEFDKAVAAAPPGVSVLRALPCPTDRWLFAPLRKAAQFTPD